MQGKQHELAFGRCHGATSAIADGGIKLR